MARVTTYERWMAEEEIPIVGGFGVEDVRTLPRQFWPRTGGLGAFIDLKGMEGFTGMVVGEIPPGGQLKPQKHLFQQLICIMEGRGATDVWLPGESPHRRSFEWSKHTLFATPLNCWYQLYNGSQRDPVIYLAVTDAPMMMDILHNEDFIFNNPYPFRDRFDGREEYFGEGERFDSPGGMIWRTNLIPDVGRALVDAQERKGAGVKITAFEMAANSLAGHLAEWPVGRYHKAHHHQGGAILTILRSHGYTLMWPMEAGVQPYQNGQDKRVIRVDWREGAVFSPPTKWFHQHFNTGPETARQLAFRFGSNQFPAGFRLSAHRMEGDLPGVYVSYRDGGTLIEYEDEDRQIRIDYEAELARLGQDSAMPPIAYRQD